MCDAAVKIAFSPLLTHHHLYTQHIYSIIIIIKAKVSQDRQTDLFRAYCEYQNTTARESHVWFCRSDQYLVHTSMVNVKRWKTNETKNTGTKT